MIHSDDQVNIPISNTEKKAKLIFYFLIKKRWKNSDEQERQNTF